MIDKIVSSVKKWKEVIATFIFIGTVISANPIKQWLLKDIVAQQEAQTVGIKKNNNISCGILKIQILYIQMNSLLAIADQKDLEIEKQKQIKILDMIGKEYEKINKDCEND